MLFMIGVDLGVCRLWCMFFNDGVDLGCGAWGCPKTGAKVHIIIERAGVEENVLQHKKGIERDGLE